MRLSNGFGSITHLAGNHGHTATINTAGGGQKANNMPPYNVVYYWHRTN